jgi:sulfur relay protein TusB/DsrH
VTVAVDTPSAVLHLVLSAGSGAFDACRRACSAGDSVLFMDNGVRQLLVGEPGKQLPPGVAMHFGKADLEARGLLSAATEARVRLLDDDGIPDLLKRHRHCLSWK